MKTILLIVAYRDFQEQEYFDVKEILEASGFAVVTASDELGIALAHGGRQTKVDILLEQVVPKDFSGIFFIGGPGALEHLDAQESVRILNEAMLLQIPYGAICIAPRILARAHVLVGKQATGWDLDGQLADIFAQNNVSYVQKPVVVDGTIITGNGPAAAKEFAEAIVKCCLHY